MYSLSIFLFHGSIQIAAHAFAGFLSVLFDDLIYIDGISGFSLFFSSIVFIVHHARHRIVGVLLCMWSLRLSAHLILRRITLGRVRSRCVAENRVSTYAFALSRCVWSIAILITMHATPTMNVRVRLEWTMLALAALVFESFADFELLTFRKMDKTHALYTRGLWSLCRHPNMFGELMFQASIFFLVFQSSFVGIIGGTALCFTGTCILYLPGGVQTLEERAKHAWGHTDEYKAYVKATPILLPYGMLNRTYSVHKTPV